MGNFMNDNKLTLSDVGCARVNFNLSPLNMFLLLLTVLKLLKR